MAHSLSWPSQVRYRTRDLLPVCTGRWTVNHWTTRKAPDLLFDKTAQAATLRRLETGLSQSRESFGCRWCWRGLWWWQCGNKSEYIPDTFKGYNHRAYCLTWVSLTLDVGYLFMAAPAKCSRCPWPWTWGSSSTPAPAANPSKRVGTERGHQRADRLKAQSQTNTQSDHMDHSLYNSMKPSHAVFLGPPKLDGSRWRGLQIVVH